uniref:Uncharacterized protein n=1 Tax=Caenorhabditis japonica TaxID=281687 RepID=A0A8R1HY15_CAEJA
MEQSDVFQEYLRKKEEIPVPLPPNFYEAFLKNNPSEDNFEKTSVRFKGPQTSHDSYPSESTQRDGGKQEATTTRIVEHLLDVNQQYINEAAMRKAASAVNVNTQQFTNLIPLSFDQEQFLKEYEASMKKK